MVNQTNFKGRDTPYLLPIDRTRTTISFAQNQKVITYITIYTWNVYTGNNKISLKKDKDQKSLKQNKLVLYYNLKKFP